MKRFKSPRQAPRFLSAHDQTQYGQLSAFSLLYSMPVVLLYLLLARKLGGGFALGGALKG